MVTGVAWEGWLPRSRAWSRDLVHMTPKESFLVETYEAGQWREVPKQGYGLRSSLSLEDMEHKS